MAQDASNSPPAGNLYFERDLPVLQAAARLMEDNFGRPVMDGVVRESLDGAFTEDDVVRALLALSPTYLIVKRLGHFGPHRPQVLVQHLTDDGRRAVGYWPAQDDGNALIAELLRVAQTTANPEERSKLERAARALAEVGTEVVGQITGAVAANLLR